MSCASPSRQIRLAEPPDILSGSEVRRLSGPIREVAPPAILADLVRLLPNQQPQVTIATPKTDQVIEDTQLEVRLDVQNFPIYKDEKLGLGPHLQLILDNQPAQLVYSLEDTITLKGLAPGSHTLRVIAVQPWGESFKNETAYAQTTFHLFGKTNENTPDPELPLLTYIEPQGTLGAEPLLLDFYLTNAPLHFLAQENSEGELFDWKIRGIVNGKDFVIDQWQPIYLKGFEPGKNWIQLTLIDEQGRPIKNDFNSTIRVIDYDPSQQDALAELIKGELPLQEVGQIVDLDYQPAAEIVTPEQFEEDELGARQAGTKNEELEVENFEVESSKALDTNEVQALEEAKELETENSAPEKLNTEEPEQKAFDTNAETEKATAPAVIAPKQPRFEQTEEEAIEETSPQESEVQNLESKAAQAEQSESTEIPSDQTTFDQTGIEQLDIEQPSLDTAVPAPTEEAPKKSLFERFFGRKSPPTTESVTERTSEKQASEEEPEPSSREASPSESSSLESTTLNSTAIEQTPSKLDPLPKTNDSAVSTDEAAQLEPIKNSAVSKEITDTVDIPTELSAPAAPTDNLLAPKSAEPVIKASDIDDFDVDEPDSIDSESTESIKLEENINRKLKADE